MGSSAAFRPHFPATSRHYTPKLCYLRRNGKQNKASFVTNTKRKSQPLESVRSVLSKPKSNISGNGATESARILLERLFAQTQKLEEQMSRHSHIPKDIQLGFNLEILESDLKAVLVALKKREADLQDAERLVLSDHGKLNHAKEELERRDKEIAIACSRHEKLEEQLRQANFKLLSQARNVEDLKLRLRERDQEIATAKATLSLKEDELDKMRTELVNKCEEAAKTDYELKCKAQLLDEISEVVNKQEIEIHGLHKAIREKEELEVFVNLRKLEEEKLKVARGNLERQTMEWFVAQEELKKLAEEVSRDKGETNGTLEDFRRVKKLLAEIRAELLSSQKALVSSIGQMKEQEQQFEKQLTEIDEQKKSVMSYMTSLRAAQIEVESEKVKLRVAEARNKEIEWGLSVEKEVIEELQNELKKERDSLQQAIREMSYIQEELEQKGTEFNETHHLLRISDLELVEAKLEIQHLRSKHASLHLILEERDLELSNARNKLEELNQEVMELQMLISSREDQLIQATTMLKEKDEHFGIIQDELNDAKLKFSEAETVVEQIVELTNKLVISIKDEDHNGLGPVSDTGHHLMPQLLDKPAVDFKLQNIQLETELKFTIECLRINEMEVLAAKRALLIKDEEGKMVLGRLDARERELNSCKKEMVEDANDLMKHYALAQERIGEQSTGDLAIEKLQLEAAKLEVEAATSALHKIAEMSQELLNKASLIIEIDTNTSVFPQIDSEPVSSILENDECLTKVTTEVARLSALTERLVKEAGIVVASEQWR
ncbi:hypothetical protein CFOL_v3_29135 [Cephalotus follicularis]|uniref:Uncharacterized protein n=1 Tax=Cephalotus follicularis TaxID=3775 RepID=A0A1Q3CZY0_CEPFO|nr:hypothetical protein CFOL_v3_29135 [Cephalotus follicularis]